MRTYECDCCGACCQTFPIFASDADAQREPRIADEGRRLPPSLMSDQWHYRLFPLPFLDACCFLGDDKRCTVYATRPDVCRRFTAGEDQCQAARQRRGLPPLELSPP
jgi:Fe-S-cluster containining protein